MSSFYISLSGLNAAQTDLNVTSNNIANVNSVGYKTNRAEFGDLISGSAFQVQNGSTEQGTRLKSLTQDLNQGSQNTTSRTLDLMIGGQGFFTTKSTGGLTSYTRDGAFSLTAAGTLVDSGGNSVQGFAVDPDTGAVQDATSTGALTVSPTNPATDAAGAKLNNLTVDTNGMISATYSDGSVVKVGQIAIATFTNPGGLHQNGNTTWTQTSASGAPTMAAVNADGSSEITSGALEQSNVDLTAQLVNLISAQRNFQANAKAIDTDKQMLSSILNMQ